MTMPRGMLPVVAAAGGFLLLLRGLEAQAGFAEIDLATPGGRIRLASLLLAQSPASLLGDLFLVVSACLAGRVGAIRLLGRVHAAVGVLLIVAVPVVFWSAGRIAGSLGAAELGVFRLHVVRLILLLVGLGGGALSAGRNLLLLAHPSSAQPTVDLGRNPL